MKLCPEYYDVRTELELVPTTTLERSSIISLTSSVNYSSHQRHLYPSLKAQYEGWIGIVNRGEDTEQILASRVRENCLLSIDINFARLVAKESIYREEEDTDVNTPHTFLLRGGGY